MAGSEASPCRILVMASGNGSNFQALIDATSSTGLLANSRIVGLVVNRQSAYAKKRAEQAGIPWEYFNLISGGFVAKGEKDQQKVQEGRRRYDAALAERILSRPEGGQRPELVVLAGWMHVFSRAFLDPVDAAGVRVINLHPALPGEFDGAGAIERAYEEMAAGRLGRTGIMVHYVIDEVDRGEPIAVEEVPSEGGESLEGLRERIHGREHGLIVRATALVAEEIVEARSK